jgi:hypothetical protein
MRIDDRNGLWDCGFYFDAEAANLSANLDALIIMRSLWRVDTAGRVFPNHRFRHGCTSMSGERHICKTLPPQAASAYRLLAYARSAIISSNEGT